MSIHAPELAAFRIEREVAYGVCLALPPAEHWLLFLQAWKDPRPTLIATRPTQAEAEALKAECVEQEVAAFARHLWRLDLLAQRSWL